ncbi:MAG: hypothetical protein ACE5ED_10150 [Rhodothalassiaceae bacterium]
MVRSAISRVGSGGRVGPIPVNMGCGPLAGKRLLLFLSQFDETGDSIHVVAVAARRVLGEVAAPTERLPDREQFLARIADRVRSGKAEHLLISLMQLPPGGSEDERSAFRRPPG